MLTYEQAHSFLENKQRMMTQNRWYFDSMEVEANGIAIEAIERLSPSKNSINFRAKEDEAKEKNYINTLLAFACCSIKGLNCSDCPYYVNENTRCRPYSDSEVQDAVMYFIRRKKNEA